ncbi:hypothetical protein ECH_0999 [Ehrlichia chaffeensis str. Arkansas]|uniref:Uncharacterized protein n=1 Tax=Ehrlichia chaffeensis (strain ATCC CRL-10679 / Arkansas) TaxID=205920 RepID=Q2GFJ7_EHRCR|nr:hypothetical protein ECH_0999 [Ehrlichia chaffeensis str. Arkansas]
MLRKFITQVFHNPYNLFKATISYKEVYAKFSIKFINKKPTIDTSRSI